MARFTRLFSMHGAANPTLPHDDFDPSLDAFDQQLLAEVQPDMQQQASQAFPRSSLASPMLPRNAGLDEVQMLRDDLHHFAPRQPFNSSPPGPTTSPTVFALHNRRPPPARATGRYSTDRSVPIPVQGHDFGSGRPAQPLQELGRPTIDLKHATPIIRGIRLVPRSELPDQLSLIFKHEIFNAIQSKCFPIAFQSHDNLVLSAPTGSGKTAVMELALCRLISKSRNHDFKAVYMAPTKSLCTERHNDWRKQFKSLGVECAELTGDTEYTNLRNVQQAQVIITTPEKWDSVTRKWKDNQKLMQLIKLFLVDEVHILKDSRGATLEAVVSRMKSVGVDVRFVALSATVPNCEDIASWLGRSTSLPDIPAHQEVFDESFRPVKLEKHVYGFRGGSNDFSFDALLMKQVPDCISRHSARKSTMVFCMTRKSCNQTAQALVKFWNSLPAERKPWPEPTKVVAPGNKDLASLTRAGVAFHHGGLSIEDRRLVENGFLCGDIKVICSTSTLAVGVNLPCYLVILQGTSAWTAQGAQEYSDLEVLQMLGRAGRPQFEKSACAVILTREEKVQRYERMVSGQELLESTLHRNLIEHLNAEIGLGTVYDVGTAKRWLNSTFFRIRLGRNPKHYQVDEVGFPQDPDELIQELCEKYIQLLEEPGFINRSGRLRCTELGDAMARYYVSYETMKTFTSVPPKSKMSEILGTLCQAIEFVEARMKVGEKAYYKQLNKANDIRYPINVDVALTAHKTSLLIQAELANVSLPSGPGFDKLHGQHATDVAIVFGHAKRLIRCIIDCQLYLQDATSTKNALELSRSIAVKAWDGTPNQLKQIAGIGPVSIRKLAAKGINSIDAVINSPPERLALVLGKQQQHGYALLKSLQSFPHLRVSVREVGREIRTGHGIKLKLKCELGFLNEIKPVTFGRVMIYVCFLVEDSNGKLIDFRRFGARKLHNGEDIAIAVELTRPTSWVRCHVMCDELAGTSKYVELAITEVPSNAYPKHSFEAEWALGKTSHPGMPVNKTQHNDFEGDELGDEELLEAVNDDDDAIEVVEDIDAVLAEAEQHPETVVATSKPTNTTQPRNNPEPEPKEQVQLENGNWTCRHTCKEKGIHCKHKCCQNGVRNPRRRSRKATKADDPVEGQKKISETGSFMVQSIDDTSSTAKVADTVHHAPTTKDLSMPDNDRLPRFPTLDRVRKRKLSHRDEVVNAKPDSAAITTLSKRAKQDFHAETEEERISQGAECDIDDLDIETELFDPIECDWSIGTEKRDKSPIDVVESPARSSSVLDDPFASLVQSGGRLGVQLTDHVPITDPQASRNEIELLGADSSSLLEQVSEPQAATPVSNNLSPRQGIHIHDDGGESTETPNMTKGGASDSRNQALKQIQQAPEGLGAVCKSEDDGSLIYESVSETARDREKRLWEEDQKKRWEGVEPWLYDMFHDIVELVD